ncbi:MAG: carbohydrate-binding module family 14 protein [Rikenellaceae bacterium]|nr:carbohydrate-binding module family 14 protein [Rikenellaceae bacterium]MCL2692232.1 carbohydrate-binding module family 14 protein [Rikenellaceae bacterium]
MKRKLFFSSATVGLLIAVIACDFSGERSKSVVRITAEQRAQIEQVGILHNEGLDFILADLMAEKIRLFKESGGNPQTRSSSGGAFPETFDFEQFAISSTGRFMKTIAPELDEDFLNVVLSSTKTRSLTQSSAAERDAEVMEILTPFQQEYYNRIMAIMGRDGMTPVILRKELAELEEEIIREATTIEEAEHLLAAMSIAVHSAEYWTENLMKWNTVLNSRIVRAIDPSEDLYQEIIQSVATRSGPESNENFFLVPHPYYKNWFIIIDLDNGTATLIECPANLVFNPNLCACDWPDPDEEEDQNSSGSSSNPSTADLWAADVAGAIGGAAAGSMAGGVGALPGAAGGGLVASAVEGIIQIFKWIF